MDEPQRFNKALVQNSKFRSRVGHYFPFIVLLFFFFMHDPYPHGGIVIK
jgi:hypothetical protein